MHGVKRVIAFCILTAVLPASLIILPLYLRHTVFADVVYPIAESDIIEIREGISSVFCQRHTLQMNSSFNAFQLNHKPEVSKNRKHIRLKKSMTLPDDTLEYWGFYLLRGATVALKVCSRFEGSRILVVRGERNLKTCGLLEHNKNKVGANLNEQHEQVLVTFESAAEIVHDSTFYEGTDEYLAPDVGNHGGEDLTDDDGPVKEDKDTTKYNEPSTAVPKYSSYTPGLNNIERGGNPRKNNILDSSTYAKTDTEMPKVNDATNVHNTSKNPYHSVHTKHNSQVHHNEVDAASNKSSIDGQNRRKRRHHGKRGHHDKMNTASVREQLAGTDIPVELSRQKRDTVYDRAINHGGNAMTFNNNASDSVSSFENGLLTCYDGNILLAQGFPPSHLCKDVQYLESGVHMVSKHEVSADGYYYYIFYSDNDYVQNDIHAVFDIFKPTFQYSNISESKGCVNSTNCSFPISFWSDEHVIVEVPTRDGIEHEEDDITLLVSICQPRMAVYIIFPISVLFLVLTCAFL